MSAEASSASTAVEELWRDQILDGLEPVLRPWLTPPEKGLTAALSATSHYNVVKRADAVLDRLALGSAPRVDDLAEQLEVSRRTLFTAYRSLLGMGPRQYLELRRLHKLRYLLKHTDRDDVTVTGLTADLGFADMGRLAKRYRSLFGENPSETLKRSKSSQV